MPRAKREAKKKREGIVVYQWRRMRDWFINCHERNARLRRKTVAPIASSETSVFEGETCRRITSSLMRGFKKRSVQQFVVDQSPFLGLSLRPRHFVDQFLCLSLLLRSNQFDNQSLLHSISLRSRQLIDRFLFLGLSLRSKQFVDLNRRLSLSLRSRQLVVRSHL